MGDMSIMAEAQATAQVLVAGRVRPLLTTDRCNQMVCAQAVRHTQQIILGNECFPFPVDYAFPIESSQSQVFDTAVQPLMDRLLQGYDTSVVTYGQPNSGKSYTMLGPGVAFHISETEYGIIPRATRYLFSKMKQGSSKKFQVKISFINVQNEMLRDLLASSQYPQELVLLESDAGYPVITGLQEEECETIEVLYHFLQLGMQKRQTEWSNARDAGRPAQAHSIFTLSLEQQWVTPEGTMEQRLSIARFADLASSEKIYFRGMGGHVLGETIHIDPGLIALGKVIQSISQPSEWMSYETAKEVYRQSTLTRILKESFGGRSFSLVVCCISPALPNFDESLVTLQFAEQFRQIRNYPVMNALSVHVQADNIQYDLMNLSGNANLSLGQGSGADTFGLEFATSQWIKLVDSAEGLFSKLVKSNTLSKQERDEIEKWLCLKHECEECVGSDGEASVPGNDGRLLEKIDEVTETEEKTDSSKEANFPDDKRQLKYDSENESETESDAQKPDFIDKLDMYIKQFKKKTDDDVNSKQEIYAPPDSKKMKDQPSDNITQHPVRSCLPNNGRRRSIHPGTQLPLMALGFNGGLNLDTAHVEAEDNESEKAAMNERSLESILNCSRQTEDHESRDGLRQEHMKPQHQLKLLESKREAKQKLKKQITNKIEGIQKTIEKLQETIEVKLEFIRQIKDNNNTRESAQAKLREDYNGVMHKISSLEKTLSKQENPNYERELEKCERKREKYERQLKNMEFIGKQLGDSSRKLAELEKSLQSSKRDMVNWAQCLKKEEEHKHSLENSLKRNAEKIHELQEKCNAETTKTEDHIRNESVNSSKDGDFNCMEEEEDRLAKERKSLQKMKEPLIKKQSTDKRDTFEKEKISLERQRNNTIEVRARTSHFDQVLTDLPTNLEETIDENEKALRLEIHNLRSTRDFLLEQRCNLDDKFQKEKTLTPEENRKLLEVDEAVEAIDATIEYKNEMICGRERGFEAGGREKGEELLMARLNNLSEMEMRMLLYKYFLKVVDLRESGRELEVQLREKERLSDGQTWEIQTLTQTIHQYRFEAERQFLFIRRNHQEKLHQIWRKFAEESNGGGVSSGTDTLGNQNARSEKEEKVEHRRLQKRVQCLGTERLHGGRKIIYNVDQASHSHKDPRVRSLSPEPVCPEPIPNKSMKQLRAAATAFTAKVTRQKNKLIIQQHKPPQTSRSRQPNT